MFLCLSVRAGGYTCRHPHSLNCSTSIKCQAQYKVLSKPGTLAPGSLQLSGDAAFGSAFTGYPHVSGWDQVTGVGGRDSKGNPTARGWPGGGPPCTDSSSLHTDGLGPQLPPALQTPLPLGSVAASHPPGCPFSSPTLCPYYQGPAIRHSRALNHAALRVY